MLKRRPQPPTKQLAQRPDTRAPEDGSTRFFAKLRDLVLIFTLGSYVFGFVLFSMYSVANDIGFLRLFDSQYFISGFLPMTLVFIGGYALVEDRWFRRFIVGRAIFFRNTAIACAGLLIIAFFLNPQGSFTTTLYSPIGTMAVLISSIFLMATVVSLLLRLDEQYKGKAKTWFYLLRKYVYSGVVILYIVGGIYRYYDDVYNFIPQELGGVQPRCQKLVLDPQRTNQALIARAETYVGQRTDSSISILDRFKKFLHPHGGVLAAEPHVVDVDVILSSSERLLVRPFQFYVDAKGREHINVRDEVFEINRSVVQAVLPCRFKVAIERKKANDLRSGDLLK